jgi:phosphoglycolate phosphatase/putative hydrolase of the HAD superfamily
LLPLEAHEHYKAWLIDLDGTLYRSAPVKLAMAAELSLAGWDAVRTLKVFRQAHERLRDEEDAELVLSPFERQLALAAKTLGSDAADVERIVREWMFERPLKWVARSKRQALVDEVSAFRARGGKTALVSDYPASGKLRALGLTNHFDVVISSGEPGGPKRLKPHPEGYLSAMQRLELTPEQCLVIGDRDDADGAAARAAGMQAFIIR